MSQTRRSFVKLLGTLAALPGSELMASALFPASTGRLAKQGDYLLSAFDDQQGQHFVGVFDLIKSQWLIRAQVQERYHSGVFSRPTVGEGTDSATSLKFIFVSRRPGKKAVICDLLSQKVMEIAAPSGQHFYGHAALDGKGNAWFTENDFQNGKGLITCRSENVSGAVSNVIDLNGIGPHELKFLSDGRHVVVGLGGIETHPDFPRKKLNLESMKSELLLVDTATSEVIHRLSPPNPQLSLRHLDVAQDNTVVVGAQFQGPKYEQFPLVYWYAPGQALTAFDAPLAVWQSMNQYIASVTINPVKQEVVVSCPRANAVHLFSLKDHQWKSSYRLQDPGGVSVDSNGHYLVSCGTGNILCLSSNNDVLALEQQYTVSDTRWDNHMDRVVFS
ncbi:DUF1513 domain-containing protein [Litoribacillus peritrichatus]|uniref:DUF1513 domain-containing protein n=1 Tax=Litoribacillus peritrichatus TaxID=718191 RepID=A0ABP7N0X2_9GAMM